MPPPSPQRLTSLSPFFPLLFSVAQALGSRNSTRAALDGYRLIELKKTLSSEPSLRLLPPRKLSTLVSPLVLEKAEAAGRATGASDNGASLSQRAIGQLVVMNERLMTMNVGCVAIPPLFTDYVAWGFMDDCLRVTNVAIAGDTSSVSSITTDKKVGPTSPTNDGSRWTTNPLQSKRLSLGLDAIIPISFRPLSSHSLPSLFDPIAAHGGGAGRLLARVGGARVGAGRGLGRSHDGDRQCDPAGAAHLGPAPQWQEGRQATLAQQLRHTHLRTALGYVLASARVLEPLPWI